MISYFVCVYYLLDVSFEYVGVGFDLNLGLKWLVFGQPFVRRFALWYQTVFSPVCL